MRGDSMAFMISSISDGRRYRIGLIATLLALISIYGLRWSLRETTTGDVLNSKPFPSTSLNPTPQQNVAAIIEPRSLNNLAPLLLHFHSVLGPGWPIVLFTSGINEPNSTAFRRAVDAGHLSIKRLPDDVQLGKHDAVSNFLTVPWLWEQLAPAGHVFLFQADSIVCANADIRVEDFLRYDFVGAPIARPNGTRKGHGEGYNGGFSLRNRSMVLDIVNSFDFQVERKLWRKLHRGCGTQEPCLQFEDQWLYHKMKDIPGARLPPQDVASSFAVETVWYDTPLGYHQVKRWNSGRLDEVAQWCPEYALATTDLLVKHPVSKG